MVSQAVGLSGLIQLKSIPRTEYIVLPYNIRMPALWTSFRGWILSCQKGVAFHDHPETWLKEAVSIWNPLENLSRLSLLRSWQTADFHNAAQIICNNITYLRDTALNGGQTDHCWKWVETFGVSFAAWGVLPCTVWYTPIATSDDGQKCPSCAEVCYDRVSTNLQPFDSKGSKTRPLNLSLTIEQ